MDTRTVLRSRGAGPLLFAACLLMLCGAIIYPLIAEARGVLAIAPTLGTAQSFAVLAYSTVTNTGPSVVTGNLGVSPGAAVTGFPPGTVVGGTIHAADAVAGQAQIDAATAYGALAGQPCTADLSGQDLGGLTLTPGVYCFSSSAFLTGTLTLDAQGDPNAVFVFKIGTTLITASNSTVRVINGGTACNVFWQVGSSATFGTGTTFLGTTIALASVTLNNGANVSGRVIGRTGAVTMIANNVSLPVCAAATLTPTAGPPTLTPTIGPPTLTPTIGLPTLTPTIVVPTLTPTIPAAATATSAPPVFVATPFPTATLSPPPPSIVIVTPVFPTPVFIVPTSTAVPTQTPIIPTSTVVVPTSTAVPTPTQVPTLVPTATAIRPTSTPLAPTATATATSTATTIPTPRRGKATQVPNFPVPTSTAARPAPATATAMVPATAAPMPTIPSTGLGGTRPRGASPAMLPRTGGGGGIATGPVMVVAVLLIIAGMVALQARRLFRS